MPKRLRQFDEPSEQALKKQVSLKNNIVKARNIRSMSSERTLNMLFEGAVKSNTKVVTVARKCTCSTQHPTSSECYFCDKLICPNCRRPCDICDEEFCGNCCLFMYEEKYNCICYSCLNNL